MKGSVCLIDLTNSTPAFRTPVPFRHGSPTPLPFSPRQLPAIAKSPAGRLRVTRRPCGKTNIDFYFFPGAFETFFLFPFSLSPLPPLPPSVGKRGCALTPAVSSETRSGGEREGAPRSLTGVNPLPEKKRATVLRVIPLASGSAALPEPLKPAAFILTYSLSLYLAEWGNGERVVCPEGVGRHTAPRTHPPRLVCPPRRDLRRGGSRAGELRGATEGKGQV